VLNLRPDPELQDRIDELATKSTEGQLTTAERAEYEGYVRANKFVAILRRQARQLSGSSILIGKTAIGRTTVRVLNMNSEEQLALRSS
jgi:uncharacterized protein YnzC (UPF0291/DUF896 family)